MMFNMSESSKNFLTKYFPKFFQFDDLDQALMAFDDFILMEGLDENDNATPFWYEAESVYDDIYYNN